MRNKITANGTELRIGTYSTRATEIGPDSPFPPLEKRPWSKVKPNDKRHMAKNHGLRVSYGAGGTLLPYGIQNGYTRELKPRDFRSIVLENKFLRATFLPELGGRLWSLVHKPTRRELLEVNPVIQIANLAYRDAWFSGGVEWNVCQVAYHTPLTCSPLFTGILQLDDGTPVLRFWEWERKLGIAYQIDAWLPKDSEFLRVRFRIRNGHDHTLPIYQWSNIAVEETPDTRVLVPAAQAFVNQYDRKGMRTTLERLPVYDGVDISYPTRGMTSRDYFFKTRARRRWITALRGDGAGLVQTSTSRQIGRKLFIWGMSPGGRRWQEYLSLPGRAYIEIQAGLCSTQLESAPMPPGATWDWLEAYGLLQADPTITHGATWATATAHVDARLDAALPAGILNSELNATAAMASRVPESIIQRGSGWGALERVLHESTGRPLPWAPGIVFDDASLGADQAPWLQLLTTGALPDLPVTAEPGAFQVSTDWRNLLNRSLADGKGSWLAWFHLGVMRYAEKDSNVPAQRAWEQSLRLRSNPWAARCLARLAMRRGDLSAALAFYRTARRHRPHDSRLAAEACDVLRLLNRPRKVLELIERLPPAARENDRVQLARAWAALDTGDYATALNIIMNREFACIREGELSLASIWFRAQELRLAAEEGVPLDRALRLRARRDCPPPLRLDMRMKPGTPEEDLADEMLLEAKMARYRARVKQRARHA